MDVFAGDVVEFCREWPVWLVLSLDEKKRTVIMERRDEYPLSVVFRISERYPTGKTTVQNRTTKSIYTFKSGERLLEAVDAALLAWEDDADDDPLALESNVSHIYDDATYSTALVSSTSPHGDGMMGAASTRNRADDANYNDFLLHRLLTTWRALARETRPPCRADVFCNSPCSDDCSAIILHLSISVRDVDAFLCLALGIQSAEYLTVVVDIPLSFPTCAPSVRRVVLCNFPGSLTALDDDCDDRLGVLGWFIKDRISPILLQTTLAVRNSSDRLGAATALPCTMDEGAAAEQCLSSNVVFTPIASASETSDDGWPLLGTSFLLYEQLTRSDETTFLAELQFLAHGDNIILSLARRFRGLILNSTAQCFVCGDALGMDGMRLSYCGKELCTFSVERVGLGVDVLSEVTKRPEVFELLMLFTFASAVNAEKRDTFIPMCTVDLSHLNADLLLAYHGPLNFFLSDTKTKNFRLILEVVQLIPSIQSMQQLSGGNSDVLRRRLNSLHPLVYPFVQWVISSNRSHVQFIPQIYHVRGLGPHQYLLINHNAHKEQRFRALKAAAKRNSGGSGSFFAWHGSATGNWHCILREGLRVYSGTKFMSSGQVYGSGIYLARSISTSLPYMGSSKGGWSNSARFTSPGGCTVLALCEVVSNPSIYADHNNDIITVSDEGSICTRFLFVFHGSHGPPASVISSLPSNEEIAAQLSAAFSFFV